LEAEIRERNFLRWINFNVHGFGVPGDFDRRGGEEEAGTSGARFQGGICQMAGTCSA
jgi:hypothetical protein